MSDEPLTSAALEGMRLMNDLLNDRVDAPEFVDEPPWVADDFVMDDRRALGYGRHGFEFFA